MIFAFFNGMVPTLVPAQAAPAPSRSGGTQTAWVVFHGQADLPWLRLLRPGFRHCYVILRAGERWLSVDPLLNRMEVQVHSHLPADFDLPGWLAGRGQTVIRAVIDETKTKAAPWRPFTCVEAVKRILGLHDRFILTPWQLYSHLSQPAKTRRFRMGSLTSTPKNLPTLQPQVVTFTEPSAAATATSGDGGTTAPATDPAGAARQAGLLERSRGLLSTVLTGFNGLLAGTTAPQRKSLLGE